MKRLHIVYPEDNKMMIDSVKLVVDNKDYILEKTKSLVIEVEGDVHKVVIKANTISNMDVSLPKDGNVQLKVDTKERIWVDTSVNLVDEDEYYIFKTPFLLSWKGKLIKVTNDVFEKKSR